MHIHADYSLKYYFLFWILLFASSLVYIRAHGIDYVAWPRLNPPVDVIYYEGPGFRKHRNGMGFRWQLQRRTRQCRRMWGVSRW